MNTPPLFVAAANSDGVGNQCWVVLGLVRFVAHRISLELDGGFPVPHFKIPVSGNRFFGCAVVEGSWIAEGKLAVDRLFRPA